MDNLLGKPGQSVPVVDAADLKVMWDYAQEVLAMHPGATSASVGAAVWQNVLGPGVDIQAVGYRCGVLTMIQSVWEGGKPSEKAFKVAAGMDLDWPSIGVVKPGLPYDLERFVAAVQLGVGC